MEYTPVQGIIMMMTATIAVGGVGLLAWASIGRKWNRYPMHQFTFIIEGDSGVTTDYKITTNCRDQAQFEAEEWFEHTYGEPGHVTLWSIDGDNNE